MKGVDCDGEGSIWLKPIKNHEGIRFVYLRTAVMPSGTVKTVKSYCENGGSYQSGDILLTGWFPERVREKIDELNRMGFDELWKLARGE